MSGRTEERKIGRMEEWRLVSAVSSTLAFLHSSLLLPLLLVMLVAGSLLLPQPLLAQENGDGVITAQIDMGTAGEPLPAGLEAELLFLPNGQGPPEITTETVNEDGRVSFAGLDTAPQHRYLVRATVDGQEYFSRLLAFEGGDTELSANVTVYAATEDLAALSVDGINLIAEARGNQWVVAALYSYANSSDRLIAPAAGNGVFIPLPAGATELSFQDQTIGQEAERIANGVQLATQFPPGQKRVLLSYLHPYRAPEQTLELPIAGPAGQVVLLVSDLGQDVTVPSFDTTDPLQADSGQTYLSFERTDVPADVTLEVTMDDLPAETPAASQQQPSAAPTQEVPVGLNEQLPRWTPLVLMVLAAAGVAVYLWRRPAPTEAEERAARRRRRDELLDHIADLDDRFEAGEIGERTYQRQREVARRELKQLLRREGEATYSTTS